MNRENKNHLKRKNSQGQLNWGNCFWKKIDLKMNDFPLADEVAWCVGNATKPNNFVFTDIRFPCSLPGCTRS